MDVNETGHENNNNSMKTSSSSSLTPSYGLMKAVEQSCFDIVQTDCSLERFHPFTTSQRCQGDSRGGAFLILMHVSTNEEGKRAESVPASNVP